MSTRPHGYARYRLDGCRCNACGWARYQYDSRRNRLVAQGRWQPFVDPAGARAHAERLQVAGLGTRQIADLAGLDRKAVQAIVAGKTRRIRPTTHAAILAVPADAEVADKTLVSAVGTVRRAQALAANGWSLTEQAEEIGWLISNYFTLLSRLQITAQTARLVRDLYGRWSELPPPPGTREDITRRRAREKSWFPPIAWDEETIDDPTALPCLLPPIEPVDRDLELLVQHVVAGHPVEVTFDVQREIVRRMPDQKSRDVARVARCRVRDVSYWRSRLEAS